VAVVTTVAVGKKHYTPDKLGRIWRWRHPDREMTADGPDPFDRAWLMRRLKLLERWANP